MGNLVLVETWGVAVQLRLSLVALYNVSS